MFVLFAMLGRPGPAPTPLPEDALQRLIAAAREHDPVAQRRLHDQLVQPIFRAVRPLFATEAEAEDVTQDTLIKVFTHLHQYAPRPNRRFLSWVLTIATNTARRRFRRKQPGPASDAELALATQATHRDPLASPEQNALAEQRRGKILRALWQLPEPQRRILSLRYGADLTAPEVAQICGTTPENVRQICTRAKPKLRALLASLADTTENGDAP